MTSRYVVVSLTENVNGKTPRTITLDEKNDSCLLGRASRKGADIVAQPDNGYFENPVVSRNHAEIRADLTYDRVYIKDIGSTHGTFVNNIRIPATVRHPIRTDDIITLGVDIKSQGPAVETVHPSVMTVRLEFGTRPAVGSNVFQVPDETSVEGSEPEDTIGRARRYLHEQGNRPIYDAIDLTQEAILPLNLTTGDDIPVPSEREDESPKLPALSGSEVEGVADDCAGDYAADYAEDDGDSEDYAEYEDDDDLRDEDNVGDAEYNFSEDDEIEGEAYDSSPEPACTCAIGDIEPSASGALVDETTNVEEVEGPVEGEGTSANMEIGFKEGGDFSQSGDEVPSLVESEEVAMNESVIHIFPEAKSHDKSTSTEDSTVSKKRKASDISRDEEPNASNNKDMTAPIVNVLPASGVQTDPSEEREPKRLRRAVDIVGYTALGGLAGALAVFTTLVVSAPSFS